MIAFYKVPDAKVLYNSSLDGFLFLRYLKMLCVIVGVGCIITWLILLPLCTYGGAGYAQLDMLTFGNVLDPNWYYVHAFLAWLYFGMSSVFG
jgi:calcium permeable stress-gated cation channel